MPINLPFADFTAATRIYAAQMMANFQALAPEFASYASGSWTPTLAFGGGNTGMTYSVQLGNYIKIGELVYFDVAITLTAKGSSTGTATITGLPYTSLRDVVVWCPTFVAGSSLGDSIRGFIDNDTTTITLIHVTGATGSTGLTDAHFGNSTALTLVGVLFTHDT